LRNRGVRRHWPQPLAAAHRTHRHLDCRIHELQLDDVKHEQPYIHRLVLGLRSGQQRLLPTRVDGWSELGRILARHRYGLDVLPAESRRLLVNRV
jgi:hypothetical protein